MNPNLEMKLKEELEELKNNNLNRTIDDLRFISSTKAIDKDGKEFLVFGTNNYLGLTHQPDVINASKKASTYGTGSTGSRLTTGASFEARELEENLSKFKSTESTLIFNTGYMANLGIIYTLTKEDDIIFSDQLNHASIIDGTRISKAKVRVYKHKDTKDLENLIQTEIKELKEKNINSSNFFIVTDGVFSMDGDIAPLPELVEIANKYNCCLIIDDAHATGVIGKTGKGTVEYYKDKTGIDLTESVDLQIGTLSKALASEGGFVCGKKTYIDYLINKSRPFIFSTALSPSTIASANAALNLLKKNSNEYLTKLQNNTKLMRNLLKEGGLNVIDGETPIIPIIIGPADLTNKFSKELEKEGILVSAIRPPSVPKGESRLRLTVIATHTKEEITFTAKTIIKIWNDLKKKLEYENH
ncbi:8-amino-7-oxononanoate synthase BioF [Methanobrevibacter ruminantium M1]|uniref:8-amino-7-oxononanoate synthase BioF n=1 Tax=Methanobrevibacter ruminantium (strain ATCC 35063 / DSM 1093 / JCM 13430 / OCM 146 / M1) TaxID=634498 RepID=D3E0R8_METRM|nr:aminotransferase class I/II-fold pyridoxal phosphate-dependent enzyme [Methanobrevibacter ruminantium]ADC47892.1 8-amino-7-oxononanoate synthase BioF [Methanobrevibacter ruminantium M1]